MDKMDQFLKRCFYHSGQYNSEDDFAELNTKLKEKEVYVRDITFFYNFILVFLFHIFFLYIYRKESYQTGCTICQFHQTYSWMW